MLNMIMSFINPVVVSIAAGVVLAGVALISLFCWRHLIGSGIQSITSWIHDYLLNWKAFFWFVNIVCMLFSSQNAGYFFGLYEPVGLALAFVLDLMIIAFMQAMLTARMRGDVKRVRLIIFFIFLCAAMSTIGNLAHNLHVQHDIAGQITGVWFGEQAPYIASGVPLLLVLLALVADIATKKNAEDMDVQEFRDSERKQVEILEARNEFLERRMNADRTFAIIQGKTPHSFRWPGENKITAQEIAEVLATKKNADIETVTNQFNALQKQHLDLLEETKKEQAKHAQTLGLLVGQIQGLQTLLGPGKNDPKSDLTSQQNPGLPSGQKDRNTDELKEVKPAFSLPQKESKNDFLEEYKTLVKTYPNVQSWQSTGQRSVTLEEIIEATNHTRKMILNRVNDKTLKATPRNPNAYLIESVLNWLLTAPLPAVKEVHVVPQTPRQNPEQNDVLEADKTLVMA